MSKPHDDAPSTDPPDASEVAPEPLETADTLEPVASGDSRELVELGETEQDADRRRHTLGGSLRRSGVMLLAFLALIGGMWLFGGQPAPRRTDPLPHAAYVWQRIWDATTQDAVRGQRDAFAQIVPLVREIEWRSVEPHAVTPNVDWSLLAEMDQPIGGALRIGSYAGPFDASDDVGRYVVAAARQVIDDAAVGGVTLSELHLDFDAASSKLDGYRVWVDAVRRAVAPTPVVVTVLPTWMSYPAFRGLIASADGFVLQVHSLERPAGPDVAMTICDADQAEQWVERAAQFGQLFDVALPTYGYVAAFSPAGEYLGLHAEGPAPDWPTDAIVRQVNADATSLAALVATWQSSRPASMRSVIWYRMPTAADRLNWAWPTLQSVMDGQAPQPGPAAESRVVEPGLIEIDFLNAGNADTPINVIIELTWQNGQLQAWDAVNGFVMTSDSSNAATLTRGPSANGDSAGGDGEHNASTASAMLSPGGRLTVAWMRFDRDTEVRAYVQPPLSKLSR